MINPTTPKIVDRSEWERTQADLLAREKAYTRAGDELAAARRRLPMTPMDPLQVVGPHGPVSLLDVFGGRRMLIVYHFMWHKGAPHQKQCEGCTHSQVAMTSAVCAYLADRDVHYAVFSAGPINEISAYRDFMGWTPPWYSTSESADALNTRNGGDLRVYLRSGDQVYQTSGGSGARRASIARPLAAAREPRRVRRAPRSAASTLRGVCLGAAAVRARASAGWRGKVGSLGADSRAGFGAVARLHVG